MSGLRAMRRARFTVSNEIGLRVWEMAEAGFVGEADGIGTVYGTVIATDFQPDAMVEDLGTRWEIARNYFKRQRIGSGTSEQLGRMLGRSFEATGIMRVADLPEGARFRLRNGMTFIKGPRLRKRFQCREVMSMRTYSVHPLAEVRETIVP